MIDFDKALTPQEVADILQISYSSVQRLCSLNPTHDGIPSYKFGRNVRVKESDLQKWIGEQRRWS